MNLQSLHKRSLQGSKVHSTKTAVYGQIYQFSDLPHREARERRIATAIWYFSPSIIAYIYTANPCRKAAGVYDLGISN